MQALSIETIITNGVVRVNQGANLSCVIIALLREYSENILLFYLPLPLAPHLQLLLF